MISNVLTRRDFSIRLISLFPALGFTSTALAAQVEGAGDVSHSGEAIHQEVVFKASSQRVYSALTDPKQFHKVVLLSEDGRARATVPTEISHEVGGQFSLFGGHIVGRHVEMVSNQRLVQAWRVVSWGPGIYSIAKFELAQQGTETKLVFDHTGFPQGQGRHLADGWKEHYWEPMQKFLA